MKNKYNKIMENIKVHEKMEERILSKINQTPIEEKSKNSTRNTRMKSILALAACLLIAVTSGVYHISNIDRTTNPPEVINPIVEYSSLRELQRKTKFNIKVPNHNFFEGEEVQYYIIDNTLVEMRYSGDNEALYRMKKGREDISGDFNQYSIVKKINVDDYQGDIKGDNDGYRQAVFYDKEFSYSITLKENVSEKKILEIIRSIK